MSLGRVIFTATHLRPVQVMDRGLRPLRRWRASLARTLEAHVLRSRPVQLPAFVHGWADGAGRFRFLGETHHLAGDDRWDPPEVSRLWLNHLHYFQYLHELPPDRATDLVLDWIEHNPHMQGPGWEPYPLSMRIREWIEWLLGSSAPDAATRATVLASLVQQVEALRWQVEHHLQGNHLLENALTLCWAATSLEGPRTELWRRRGQALLERCLRRQVLRDGTHEERTPMYQAILAEALLRLGAVAGAAASASNWPIAALADGIGRRLQASLDAFVHPDGEYALVQDTALRVGPTIAQLGARFGSLPGGQRQGAYQRLLPDAGYAVAQPLDGTRILVDVGPIGPDHQPGHGHAGALGFELSHRGRRLITDTGTGTYEIGEMRTWDRSTAAHNTIEVDGMNQSDVWASFRCGRRIRALPSSLSHVGDRTEITGGYHAAWRGRGGLTHERRTLVGAQELAFVDRVRFRGEHIARLRLHLAPDVQATPQGAAILLQQDGRTMARVHGACEDWQIGTSRYHPTFGEEIERTRLLAEVPFHNELSLAWTVDLL